MKQLRPNQLDVIYEDNHVIVVNKPCGILVQGDNTKDLPIAETIKAYLKNKYDKPGNVYLGVVHRLDRPTSGVLIFAKTSKALTRLNTQFKDKTVQKIYWAMVSPKPNAREADLVHYLVRKPKQNKSFAYKKEVPNSKRSLLSYKLLRSLDTYHLLEIVLQTGRHHQIRAQLSAIGCTIKGDLKYGAKRSNPNAGIHLHARQLSFIHPTTTERMSFQAALPKEKLWNLVL